GADIWCEGIILRSWCRLRLRNRRIQWSKGGTNMTMLRIFLCYEATDTNFATQILTDLRAAGAEVITDRVAVVGPCSVATGAVPCVDPTPTNPDDTVFEQFLSEELSQCQQLIVIQTPEALQSLRIRAIVDAALKHMQAGQMTGV